ncbi:putative cofD-like protein [Volucribacter psittacicida]|uniref:Putative gluconeogenesis factor n=1 Tax=Volucribacter psittacicida TaxID=203482 RepID=A0A4R1G4P5_9PAST|nr:putative cofD-like protein [Volucribacter psittacicida]
MLLKNPSTPLTDLKHIVAIGGGHGLGRILSALNFMQEKLTGIVTTTDNGGSTGRIRENYGGIAWGDLRNCLNQIITEPSTASTLFEYRFGGKGELAGHNLGNLMLTALENMQIRPLEGVNLVRDLLKVKSFIIPMSETPVHLVAQLSSGQQILGEVNIDNLKELPQSLALTPLVSATPEAITALEQAELILIGPGSFFTSIMPPLLLKEVQQCLRQKQCPIIFIDNLGVEHSPAAKLSLAQRINWIHHNVGKAIIDGIITTTQQPYEKINGDKQPLWLQRQLNADDVQYRHDRHLLCQAITDLLKML